jgi:hypothetical protein
MGGVRRDGEGLDVRIMGDDERECVQRRLRGSVSGCVRCARKGVLTFKLDSRADTDIAARQAFVERCREERDGPLSNRVRQASGSALTGGRLLASVQASKFKLTAHTSLSERLGLLLVSIRRLLVQLGTLARGAGG